MFVANTTRDQFIPRKGAACAIQYHEEVISGLSSEGSVPNSNPVAVVDRLTCDTGELQAP